MSDTERLFVACTPGLEGPLDEELRELGVTGAVVPGGVEVRACPSGTHQRLNRWSRVATRVLLRVADVDSPNALTRVPLAALLSPELPVQVELVGQSTPAWAAAAQALGARWPAKSDEPIVLQLRVSKRGASVSVDTSGALLHLRGYRQEVGRAPMRETLASGFLRLVRWQPTEPLWDVMCGSGTILIEAAERSLGLAPGRNRHFAFERFSNQPSVPPDPVGPVATSPPITGSDLNAGALGTARRNARRSGVFTHLTLERLDATKLPPRPPPGLVVANLPYGKRVGERSELAPLYQALGASVTKALPGWRFGFLLEEGAAGLGLTLDGRHPVTNGGLRCEAVWGRI